MISFHNDSILSGGIQSNEIDDAVGFHGFFVRPVRVETRWILCSLLLLLLRRDDYREIRKLEETVLYIRGFILTRYLSLHICPIRRRVGLKNKRRLKALNTRSASLNN